MSLSRPNRRVVLLSLAALGGCGFQPVYGPSGAARAALSAVAVDGPTDGAGFELVKALEERLGRPGAPLYRLSYDLSVSESGFGEGRSQGTYRRSVIGKADFSLLELASGRVLTRGSVNSFASYTVASADASATPTRSQAPISTEAARQDARRRLMAILADQIVTQLSATSGDWAQ